MRSMTTSPATRRLPIGTEALPGGGAHVRVWAPKRTRVTVILEGGPEIELAPEQGGYFSGVVAEAPVGSRYRFRLDDNQNLHPDPASRSQPEGPHGPSELVD